MVKTLFLRRRLIKNICQATLANTYAKFWQVKNLLLGQNLCITDIKVISTVKSYDVTLGLSQSKNENEFVTPDTHSLFFIFYIQFWYLRCCGCP